MIHSDKTVTFRNLASCPFLTTSPLDVQCPLWDQKSSGCVSARSHQVSSSDALHLIELKPKLGYLVSNILGAPYPSPAPLLKLQAHAAIPSILRMH